MVGAEMYFKAVFRQSSLRREQTSVVDENVETRLTWWTKTEKKYMQVLHMKNVFSAGGKSDSTCYTARYLTFSWISFRDLFNRKQMKSFFEDSLYNVMNCLWIVVSTSCLPLSAPDFI
jgi:hypothetical protein